MGHHVAAHRQPGPRRPAPKVSPRAGGGQGGEGWRPRVNPRPAATYPLRLDNPPCPLAHSSHLLLSSHVWSRANELEETPRAGRRRGAGFLVPVFLLPLLCWTESRTTSMHRTCVIPRRRCSCDACLHRMVRLDDLEVGFGCLP
jgi:hypothetical protein